MNTFTCQKAGGQIDVTDRKYTTPVKTTGWTKKQTVFKSW